LYHPRLPKILKYFYYEFLGIKVALSSCYVSAHVSLQLLFFGLWGKTAFAEKKKKDKSARTNLFIFGRAKHNLH